MRAVTPRAAAPDQAPYAEAEAAFAEAKAYLSSREARQMSESDLERVLQRRGQELMRKLLQGHLDQRSPGEAAGPVEGADGVERSERRVHERHLETTFGTVEVERLGYRGAPVTTVCIRSMPRSTCRRSVTRSRCAAGWRRRPPRGPLTKRCSSCLAVPGHRCPSVRRNSWWFGRLRTSTPSTRPAVRRMASRPPRGRLSRSPSTARAWCCNREDLREATRKAAERRRQHKEPLSRFHRLKPGEKKHSKRMATVAAVYTTAPFVRSPEDFLESLMPRPPGAKPRVVFCAPRSVAKRVWASLEREPWEVVAEATLEAERQDPEHGKRWVALVDGAEPQLDLVEASAAAYGVDVTVILDIIHVVEYVWKAAHVFHREGSPELACWAWTRVRGILEGKASKVAAAMRRAATVAGFSSDTRKPVDTCADYLLKYAPYLHYDRYLAAGYPIATGVIEGACRYLVRDRIELTGARWRLVGAEAVLKLRALRASRDFDAYWDFHEAREYQRNHAQRYLDGIAPPVTEPPPRPPHHAFDGSSSSCRAARRNPLGRRRRRAAPFSEPVTGFKLEDRVVGNGSSSALQGNNGSPQTGVGGLGPDRWAQRGVTVG